MWGFIGTVEAEGLSWFSNANRPISRLETTEEISLFISVVSPVSCETLILSPSGLNVPTMFGNCKFKGREMAWGLYNEVGCVFLGKMVGKKQEKLKEQSVILGRVLWEESMVLEKQGTWANSLILIDDEEESFNGGRAEEEEPNLTNPERWTFFPPQLFWNTLEITHSFCKKKNR